MAKLTLDITEDQLRRELIVDLASKRVRFLGGLFQDSPELVIPVIEDFTDAQHTHAVTGEGGQISHADLSGVTAGQHHAPVTLGVGSDAILTLSGQELTLGDVATQAELDTHAGAADPHTQYALLIGRAGGQALVGGIAASEDLTLSSTSHATKGDVLLNPAGGNVGIGTTTPGTLYESIPGILEVVGPASVGVAISSNAAGSPTSLILANQGNSKWHILSRASVANRLEFFAADGTSDGAKVTILQSGQVGIGTVTPDVLLTVVGHIGQFAPGTSAIHYLGESQAGGKYGSIRWNDGPEHISLGTQTGGETTQLVLDEKTNVGIGTASFPSTGTRGLVFGDGIALATMAANTAGLYADDIAGNVSMHAINENGDVIKLIKTGTYTPTNVVADRSYDANATTVEELADALGTLIADLQLTGLIG